MTEPSAAETRQAPARRGRGGRLSRVLGVVDGGFAGLANQGLRRGVPLVAYAVSLGGGLWWLTHPSQRDFILSNKLGRPERLTMVGWMGLALLALAITYTAIAVVARRRFDAGPLGPLTDRLNRIFALSVLAPILAGLAVPKIETKHAFITIFLALAAALVVGVSVHAWPSRARALGPPPSWLRSGAVVASLLLLAAAFTVVFSRLAINTHHALGTAVFDLAIYDNVFFQSSHGTPLGCSLCRGDTHVSAHFDPILILLSPLHRLYPHAESLLVLQCAWLALGVIPAYLMGRRVLGSRGAGLALACVWILCPAMQGASQYDFHSLTLFAPVFLWMLYLLQARRYGWFLAVLPFALLIREDIALVASVIGVYALLTREPGAVRVGWITILVSGVYFLFAKLVFMAPSGLVVSAKKVYDYAYYYKDLIPNDDGASGALLSLLTDPVYVLRHILTEPKSLYFLQIFGPLCFLPFFAKPGRFILLYGLAFTLLASREPVFRISFQYSTTLFPAAIALTPVGIATLAEGPVTRLGWDAAAWRRGAVASVLAASLLMSWQFGGFLPNDAFRGGFGRPPRELDERQRERYEQVRTLAAMIPPEARVAATGHLVPHVSGRATILNYPGDGDTEFLLVNEEEFKAPELKKFQEAIKAGKYIELARNGKFVLLRPPAPGEAARPLQPAVEKPGTLIGPPAPSAGAETTRPPASSSPAAGVKAAPAPPKEAPREEPEEEAPHE